MVESASAEEADNDKPSPPQGLSSLWSILRPLLRPYRRRLLIANLIAICGALAAVPIPLLMPILVDEVLLGQPGYFVGLADSLFPGDWQGPVLYIFFVFFVAVLLRLSSTALAILQTRLFTLTAKDISYRLRRDLLAHLERVRLVEYETRGSGGLTANVVNDVQTIDDFIGGAIGKFVVAVLTLVGTAVILFWMHWQLALLIMLVNPMVIYLTVYLGKRVKHLKARENLAVEDFQQDLTESLEGIHQIRAANRSRFFFDRVLAGARRVRDESANFSWRTDAANRASFVLFLIGFEAFRAVSMLMVVFSDLTIGEMMAVFGYLWFMMGPVQEVLAMQFSGFAARAAFQRLDQLQGLPVETGHTASADPFIGHQSVGLSVRDLVFAYDDGPDVLDGLSLEVGRGEKVALIGTSGGGKSTLVQIILGLYPPSRGQVLFDEVDSRHISLETLRDSIAVVLQHPALFNASLRMNLDMGRGFADEQLWEALRLAQLQADVAALENGLDTIIGRQGVRLSGGQRQRLAIARMILSDPKVVILDEATSALDVHTEARVHQSLRDFLGNRTTLIIAHRLSAIRMADRSYVMDAGRIVEHGSHDTLMANNGAYAGLFGVKGKH